MIGILTRYDFFLALDLELAIGDVDFMLSQYFGDYETRRRLIDESGEIVQLSE